MIRHSKEREQIRLLNLKIKQEKKRIMTLEDIRCFTSAINSANKMFREANQPNNQPNNQPDVNEKPITNDINIKAKIDIIVGNQFLKYMH